MRLAIQPRTGAGALGSATAEQDARMHVCDWSGPSITVRLQTPFDSGEAASAGHVDRSGIVAADEIQRRTLAGASMVVEIEVVASACSLVTANDHTDAPSLRQAQRIPGGLALRRNRHRKTSPFLQRPRQPERGLPPAIRFPA